MTTRSPRNFQTYAWMEAGNAVLVPAFARIIAPPEALLDGLAFGLAVLACAGFLLIGALYWRGMHDRIVHSRRERIETALTIAERARLPLLAITGVSIAADIVALAIVGLRPANIAACALTLLACLEYVNYYHVQLQNFDRWSDFKRLLAGQGLRRSHMARDLAMRSRTQAAPRGPR